MEQTRKVDGHSQHARKIWCSWNVWFLRYACRETDKQTLSHHNTPLLVVDKQQALIFHWHYPSIVCQQLFSYLFTGCHIHQYVIYIVRNDQFATFLGSGVGTPKIAPMILKFKLR